MKFDFKTGFIIKMSYDEFRYLIESIKIVDADDTTVIRNTPPERS